MTAALGYLLTDPSIRRVWVGPVLKPIESIPNILAVPRRADRQLARIA
jgi:hypothetical protein